ncbi:TPA: ISL3 family transposase, partial [Enterococcus faecium]|nr:ISL3 family transposase [Enterococcus faecium]
GAMSFIMMDGETNQLFDILENRQLSYLKKYFYRFSTSQRGHVTHIVMDMYSPYMSLVHKLFPKAKLLIDCFHIVQHIGRTFRNHRISWTNLFLKDPQDRSKGKQLKRYWKLLQKNQDKLNYQKPIWRPSFKKHLTETEIVDRLLSYSDELKIGCDIYQGFLYRVKKWDVLGFSELLALDDTALPNQCQTTLNTFKKYHKQIKNARRYPYSNGPLECLNNHIKVLKRNAYGFRDFYHFKLRIFYAMEKHS